MFKSIVKIFLRGVWSWACFLPGHRFVQPLFKSIQDFSMGYLELGLFSSWTSFCTTIDTGREDSGREARTHINTVLQHTSRTGGGIFPCPSIARLSTSATPSWLRHSISVFCVYRLIAEIVSVRFVAATIVEFGIGHLVPGATLASKT